MTPFIRTDLDNDRSHAALLFLRVLVTAFLLTHGVPKVATLFGGEEIHFADPLGLGPTPSLFMSAFAEALCSLFVLIGLGTRLALMPLIINFSVISFIVHAQDPWQRKELPFLFLVVFIALLILGPGKYSADGIITGRWKRRQAAAVDPGRDPLT